MLDSLLGAVRADLDRQLGWAKGEVGRQTRYTVLTAVLAAVAALAALGAIVVGLIALYLWLATQVDPLIALGMIGGGLLLLALILLAVVSSRRRPRVALRPRLQITQPAALLGTLRQDSLMAGGRALKLLPTDTVRHGSRSAMLGTLVLVAVIGLVIGRGRSR